MPFSAEDFITTEVKEPTHVTTVTASVARFGTVNTSNYDLGTSYVRIAHYTTSGRRGRKLEVGVASHTSRGRVFTPSGVKKEMTSM
jgi:hypothetical protein